MLYCKTQKSAFKITLTFFKLTYEQMRSIAVWRRLVSIVQQAGVFPTWFDEEFIC